MFDHGFGSALKAAMGWRRKQASAKPLLSGRCEQSLRGRARRPKTLNEISFVSGLRPLGKRRSGRIANPLALRRVSGFPMRYVETRLSV